MRASCPGSGHGWPPRTALPPSGRAWTPRTTAGPRRGRTRANARSPPRPRIDHVLHDLERVERAAESGLGVGHERGEPIDRVIALQVRDLVGALEGVVDAAQQGGNGVGGVEALIGIHLVRVVGVGGHLPAAHVDGLEPRLDLLDRLVAGDRREDGDVILLLQQPPQRGRTVARERVLDVDRAAQPIYVSSRVRAGDAVPATVRSPITRERAGELLLVHGSPVRVEASRPQSRYSYATVVRNSANSGPVASSDRIRPASEK